MPRLSNLDKLFLVPVIAVRTMVIQKLANDETHLAATSRLPQDQLIAEVDRVRSISEADIDALYESFRYGRRLSLQIFLLPDDYASVADDFTIERTIAELTEAATVTDESADSGEGADDDYSWDEITGRVTVCDHVRFGDVLEIRFRYLILHRFLNENEESDQVLETRYGYVWLCPTQRYLAVLAKDDSVAKKMLETVSVALKVIPKSVQFPKDLIDQHFDLDNAKRLSHLDLETGVRQSISGGKDAMAGYMDEIMDRDRRFMRPGALYEEAIDETMSSGLGLTAKRGKVYFTRTLATTQVHRWADTRLREFVADLNAALNERPEKVYQPTALVRRLRGLTDIEKMHLELVLDAVVYAKRYSLQTVQTCASADAVYSSLGDKWLRRHYRFSCPECDEACGFCPNCGSAEVLPDDKELLCRACGQTLCANGKAILRCVNDHIHGFSVAESIGYIPTQKLQDLIAKSMGQQELPWNMTRDTIYLDAGGLHYLSAPSDTTIVNHYGDHIVANVGKNARNIYIGKDIRSHSGSADGSPTGQGD